MIIVKHPVGNNDSSSRDKLENYYTRDERLATVDIHTPCCTKDLHLDGLSSTKYEKILIERNHLILQDSTQRRLANVSSMPHLSRVSSINLTMLAAETKKKKPGKFCDFSFVTTNIYPLTRTYVLIHI